MSIPKEPRQLMINLMYLVLTALLALQMSTAIINAFTLVENGIKGSNAVLLDKNKGIAAGIQATVDKRNGDALAKDVQDRATKAKDIGEDFISYIEGIKEDFIKAKFSGQEIYETNEHGEKDMKMSVKKDQYAAQGYFLEKGKGTEVKNRILETRQKMLALLPDTMRERIEKRLTLNVVENKKANDPHSTWEAQHFDHLPVAAINTLLTKFQSDARADEGTIMEALSKLIGVKDIIMDQFQAVVSPKTPTFLLEGEKYEADIFLSSFSSLANNIYINGAPMKGGKSTVSHVASGLGTKKFGGTITVKDPTGASKPYPYNYQFEVGTLGGSVSLDKMNVFYIGVDNPVTVAVSGAKKTEVQATMSGGSISPNGEGKYTVRVSAPGTARITVTAKGKTVMSPEFRIKRIPDPMGTLSPTYKPGGIPSGTFKAQGGVIALLENFDFDCKFTVESYELTYAAKRQDLVTVQNSGARYNGASAAMVAKAKPGDVFFYDNTRVRGCDGSNRKLPSFSYKIN